MLFLSFVDILRMGNDKAKDPAGGEIIIADDNDEKGEGNSPHRIWSR